MATELYDLVVPALRRGLTILDTLLDKGAAYAREQGIAEDDLLGSRLIADMAPLTRQVQIASDGAKGAIARLSGTAPVAMPDDETSIADLKVRIAKTLALIDAADRTAIDGKEDAEIVLALPNGEFRFTGRTFVTTFALPNFYFHLTTAYDLMRMRGVPIGKRDYLGA